MNLEAETLAIVVPDSGVLMLEMIHPVQSYCDSVPKCPHHPSAFSEISVKGCAFFQFSEALLGHGRPV